MPHSPYEATVYPPIRDLDPYRRELIHARASQDSGVRDQDAEEALLENAESLLEHCDFLEVKLDMKVRGCSVYAFIVESLTKGASQKDALRQSVKEVQGLEEKVGVLEEQNRTLKEEIAALKLDLEKARAGEIDPQNGALKSEEVGKSEISENSLVTSESANPRKRSPEDDTTKDVKKLKK